MADLPLKEVALGAWRAVRTMARPDWPLLLALFAGLSCGLAMPTIGQLVADCIEQIAREHPAATWLPYTAWSPIMLIGCAVLAVILYLIIRGYRESGIRRGRVMGAYVTVTCQVGVTTSEQETCNVVVEPHMIINAQNPPPPHIFVCTLSKQPCNQGTERRVRLDWEPDTQRYAGMCDELIFHDAIIRTMSVSQAGNHATVRFPGKHFAEVGIRHPDGKVDCFAIATCVGLRLHVDPVRDGVLATG